MPNKEGATSKNKAQDVIEGLEIQEGDSVADLGFGGGYFTLAFAKKVGKGSKVYAADMKPEYLAFIGPQASRAG